MDDAFKRVKCLARAFYEGWKWSLSHHYTEKDYEAFVNDVEEPMNEEVTRLRNQGVSMVEIDHIFEEAKAEVGFCLNNSLRKQVI